MDPVLRIVTQLPLPSVWGADGLDLRLTERSGLSSADVHDLLREPAVAFVVAEVGHALRWVDGNDRYDFWKREVSARVAPPDTPVYLEDFPGKYCYLACEWAGADGRIVLLAKLR